MHKSDVIRKLGGVDMAFEAVGEPMFGTSLRCLRYVHARLPSSG